jgi:polysaccharide pyruvyl transferase CsaB
MSRKSVLISGYYGFDNLGDEAILEEICNELKELIAPEDIVVLSAAPETTSARYGVRAILRSKHAAVLSEMMRARLFISGGGGLFQNTRTLGSILFYGLQMFSAKLLGCRVMVYAQGLGPLIGKQAEQLTCGFFRLADSITVRDDASAELLHQWNIPATRTADPVWSLKESDLASELALQELPENKDVLALSLRPSLDFTDAHVRILAELLHKHLPSNVHALLLPLQSEQDIPALQLFEFHWRQFGRGSTLLDTTKLQRPSQWLSIFRRCRWLVGMRLHALILAIKAGLPVAGIAYDPKVTHVLQEFGQPCLILTKDCRTAEWEESLKFLISSGDSIRSHGQAKLLVAQNLSCQNFELLARILGMQRGC